MQNFTFYNPIKVYFGENIFKDALNVEMKKCGKNVVLAYGGGSIKRTGLYQTIIECLEKLDKRVFDFGGIMPNPTYEKVQDLAKLCREKQIDFVLAVGGGSVIDCVKVAVAQAKMQGDLWTELFENGAIIDKYVDFGSIVTASGTGAEMNDHGVITNQKLNRKAGVSGAMPKFAVLDPTLTLTVPKMQVMSGAFDTLSHAYESMLGTPRNENITDSITQAVMRSIIKNMRVLKDNPNDLFTRGELMWDSALAENGMLKIGKVGAFQVHQLEHQLGAFTDCNHGQGLAVLHPYVYRHIYKTDISQFAAIARNVWNIVGSDDEKVALLGIEALSDFIKEVGLPTTLREIGVDKAYFNEVASTCNILPSCSKQMDKNELLEILNEAY